MVSKDKWQLKDYLFFLILLLEDAGMFSVLPIGIAQILIIILGVVIIVEHYYGVMKFDKKIAYLMIYIFMVTIFNRFDMASIKGMILFFIELIVLYLYLCTYESYEKIFAIIYKTALLLAIIGILQEISFLVGFHALTDMTIYGFPRENVYETGFFLARVSSLYSEPASLCAILSAAFFVGLLGGKKIGVNKFNFLMICIFILLTQSAVTYVTCIIVLMVYILFSDISKNHKIIIVVAAGIFVAVLLLGDFGFMRVVLLKLSTLRTASSENSTDLSAFALISNIRVAVAKNLDGYIFGTGFNSHRLYYDNYVSQFYSSIFMKLNYNDAGSMYTRILSEFGIVGFLVFIGALIKNFISAVKLKNNYLIVCITIPMVSFLRNGNYNNSLCIALLGVALIISKNRDIMVSLKDEG